MGAKCCHIAEIHLYFDTNKPQIEGFLLQIGASNTEMHQFCTAWNQPIPSCENIATLGTL